METQKTANQVLTVIQYYDGSDDAKLYLADQSIFEQMPVSSTYDKFGKQVTAEDAGDHLVVLSDALLEALNNELAGDFELNQSISAYNNEEAFLFVTEHGKEGEYELFQVMCKAYNYFDGSNWKSVIIECNEFDTHYSYVDKAESDAIMNDYEHRKSFGERNTGIETLVGKKYLFHVSKWGERWETAHVEKTEMQQITQEDEGAVEWLIHTNECIEGVDTLVEFLQENDKLFWFDESTNVLYADPQDCRDMDSIAYEKWQAH